VYTNFSYYSIIILCVYTGSW